MPEIRIEQLEELGGKLDGMRDQFSPEERDLLLTTFGLAAQTLGNVGQEGGGEVAGDDTKLTDGLRAVFFPGRVGQFERLGARSDGVEVGGTITWSK